MLSETKKPKSRTKAQDFFPKDEATQKILHERAKDLSQVRIKNEDQITKTDYIRCLLGSEYYGIIYRNAKEVMHNFSLTNIPKTPIFIAGVVNRRGKLLTVLDLCKFFQIDSQVPPENKYIIVVESAHIIIGLLVDKIEGSNMFDPKELEQAISLDSVIPAEYVIGLHAGNNTILNVDKILAKINADSQVKKE